MSLARLPPDVNVFTGLMRDVYNDCLKQATQNEGFALACTLQLLGGLAQNVYQIVPGCDPDSTNMYQIIIAPPASGKSGMVKWMRAYLKHVAPDLEGPEWASKEAGRATLTLQPSQIHVVDELATKWKGAYSRNARPDSPVSKLVAFYLEMHGSVDRLPAVKARKAENNIDAVDRPRLSLLGFTTPGEMNELRSMPSYASGGMESRFLIWEDREQTDLELTYFRGTVTPDPVLLTRLTNFAIAQKGGYRADKPDPGSSLSTSIRLSAEVNAFANKKMGSLIRNKMHAEEAEAGSPDERLTSLRLRYYGMALRIAAIHCIGCERGEISNADMNVGLMIAINRMALASTMISNPLPTAHDAAGQQVLEYLERAKRETGEGKREKRWLAVYVSKFKRLPSDDDREKVLATLCRMGDILMEGKVVRLRESEADADGAHGFVDSSAGGCKTHKSPVN